MIIGPKYKIARRLGERIFSKTQNTKFSISGSERSERGGRPRATSDYGRQLIEKQKARYTYGVPERQFANYVKKIKTLRATDKSLALFRALERRLDNVVYRLGLATSRLLARQLVAHGHILVNGRKVRIPSFQVSVGDIVAIRPGSKAIGPFRNLEEKFKDYQPPIWLKTNPDGSWAVAAVPEAQTDELNLNFGTIIEYYGRV